MGSSLLRLFRFLDKPCLETLFCRKEETKEFHTLGGSRLENSPPAPEPGKVSARGAELGLGIAPGPSPRASLLASPSTSQRKPLANQVCRSFWHMDFDGGLHRGWERSNRSERPGDGEAARFSKCCCWTAAGLCRVVRFES